MSAELLENLNPEQSDAVTHHDGPLLILAGPGSGKTRVITRRVAWLLHNGIHPSRILAITFTNKAAQEMRDRVEALVPQAKVHISTFHAFGARLLREYGSHFGQERNFTVYDMDDREKLLKIAIEDAGLAPSASNVNSFGAAISKAKNQLITPELFENSVHDYFTQCAAKVFPRYQKRLRESNACDFDDLLYVPALALQKDKDLRSQLDNRWHYTLVDEYQDTNKAQYAIARELNLDHPNICVVGDPDQSIYRFRGSDIRNILDFERDYPAARVIKLGENYRSTRNILAVADALITHNTERKPKPLVTNNQEGKPVRITLHESGDQEAESVAQKIADAVEAKRWFYRDFAVFVRTNALTRSLESAFIQARVPFQIVKGLAFFERKENKDILAYLRLMSNPRDDVAYLRIVNEPARNIGKKTLDTLAQFATAKGMSLLEASRRASLVAGLRPGAVKALVDFSRMMDDLRSQIDQPPASAVTSVLDKSGYRKALSESGLSEDQERLANIEEMITVAAQYAATTPEANIQGFLENVALSSSIDGYNKDQDCVSVMTLHAAKGLEFPVVFMVAMEEGILPSAFALPSGQGDMTNSKEIEEERRLAFVGMTRAMKELYLSHCQERSFRGVTRYALPSRFLAELARARASIETVDRQAPRQRISHDYENEPDPHEWFGEGNEPGTKPPRPVSHSAPAFPGSPSFVKKRVPEPIKIPTGPSLLAADPTHTPRVSPPAFKEGNTVRHQTYGIGLVMELSGMGALRKIKIRFQTAGIRSFILDKAQLELVVKGRS